MSDRRQLKRFPSQMPVWCEADDFTMYVHTQNVSGGGLFVRTSTPLPPRTPFTVVFKELEAAAAVRVSWVREAPGNSHSGMGLEITAFERGEDRWKDFIAEQADGGRSSAPDLPEPD